MIMNIRTKGFELTPALKGAVDSHLRLTVSRYDNIIERVDVSLMDVNGDNKGGIDKSCLISIRLPKAKSIVVQETEADMYDAISICASKLQRTLVRRLGKQRRISRRSIRINNFPVEAA